MRLTDVIRYGSAIKGRLLDELRYATTPQTIVVRTEEAAAIEHLLSIARQHLRQRMNPAAVAIELQRVVKHICQASYDGDGKLLDECARCGHNFRDTSVHESLANSAAEEPKS